MPIPTPSYPLPGSSFDIADNGLRIAAPVPGTKLTIYGRTTGASAAGIAINEAQQVSSVPGAIRSLKNADGSDSELSKAVEMAAAAGAKSIEVVVIAETSEFANENARWDALKAGLKATKNSLLDIIIAPDAFADVSGLSGSDPDGESRTAYTRMLGDFCYRAARKGNTVRGVVGLRPLLKVAKDEAWSVAPTSDAEVLFAYPTQAQLDEWQFHVTSVAGILEDHTAETVLDGYVFGSVEQSPGVISTSYDHWAREEDGTIAVDWHGNNVDGARAICVFGAPCRQVLQSTVTRAAVNGYGGETSENTNGAVAYAAFLTTLGHGESATNQPVPSIIPARFTSESLGEAFLNARIVTMASRTKGFVVTQAITGAHNASPYTRSDFVMWSTFDLIIRALDLAKNVTDRFSGKPASPELINAMQAQVDDALHSLVRAGLALEITSTVYQDRDQAILGKMSIELNIRPVLELTHVAYFTALRK